MKPIKIFAAMGLMLLICNYLASCGSSSGSSSGGGGSPTSLSAPLSIDSTGTVPSLNGGTTAGVLYIRNNRDTQITGVTFSLANESSDSHGIIMDINGFSIASNQCNTIPAGGYCALNITTPSMSFGDTGNSLVKLRYTYAGNRIDTSQVVNYSYVDATAISGVNFVGSVSAVGKPGTTQYVVAYLIAGSAPGEQTTYTNIHLVPNMAGISAISNGFINGSSMFPNQVIAVEFAINLANNSEFGLSIVPSYTQTIGNSRHNTSSLVLIPSYTQTTQHSSFQTQYPNHMRLGANSLNGSSLHVTLIPTSNAAHLIFGNVGYINLAIESSVEVNVINNGVAPAGNITVTTTSNNVIVTNGCANITLESLAANSCNINYTVIGTESTGQAQIKYYLNGTLVGNDNLTWLGGASNPALTITTTSYNIFSAINESTPITFTINNIGNAPISNVAFSVRSSYYESLTNTCESDPNHPGKYLINPQQDCQITGQLISGTNVSTTLYMVATGSYNSESYSFVSKTINYIVGNSPILAFITPEVGEYPYISVINNNINTSAYTFVIQNVGTAIAGLSSTIVTTNLQNTGIPTPSINANTCNSKSRLNIGESCIIELNYSQQDPSITGMDTGLLTEPYAASLSLVSYFGYSILPPSISLSVSSNMVGSGTLHSPYAGYGYVTTPQTITLTYKNDVVGDALNYFNVNTNGLPIGISVESSSTCAYGNNTQTLNANDSCTLILQLNQTLLIPQGDTVTFGGEIAYPSISWNNGESSLVRNVDDSSGNNGFYLNYTQATVTASLNHNNRGFSNTTLTIALSNADNYTFPIQVNVSAVDTWLSAIPTSNNSDCTVNANYSVSCSFSSSPSFAGITYTMPQSIIYPDTMTIPLNLTSNVSNLSLTPAYIAIKYIPQEISGYVYMTTQSNNTMYICPLYSSAYDPALGNTCTSKSNSYDWGSGTLNSVAYFNNNLYVLTSSDSQQRVSVCPVINNGASISQICTESGSYFNPEDSLLAITIASIDESNYAYILDNRTVGGLILQKCVISSTDGSINTDTCSNQNESNPSLQSLLSSATRGAGLAYNNGYIYIATNSGVIGCTLGSNGTITGTCNNTDNNNIASGFSIGSITAESGFAYVGSEQNIKPFKVARCTLSSANLTDCADLTVSPNAPTSDDFMYPAITTFNSQLLLPSNYTFTPTLAVCSLDGTSCIDYDLSTRGVNDISGIVVVPFNHN